MAAIKESFLLSKSEVVKLSESALDTSKVYSETNLIDQYEKKSITTTNSLSNINELSLGTTNKVVIGDLNINSIKIKFEHFKETVLKFTDIRFVT